LPANPRGRPIERGAHFQVRIRRAALARLRPGAGLGKQIVLQKVVHCVSGLLGAQGAVAFAISADCLAAADCDSGEKDQEHRR
jgi:hypothetical protein